MNKKHCPDPETATSLESDVCRETAPQAEADQAAGAVALAEAELKRAKQTYDRVYDEAIRRLRDVREAKVGDLCDGVLETVKRYPGPSVFVAALLGFFLGRLFRR